VDRLANVSGLLAPYHIAQVQLSHVSDEFEHSRSSIETASEGKWKTVPCSAGN